MKHYPTQHWTPRLADAVPLDRLLASPTVEDMAWPEAHPLPAAWQCDLATETLSWTGGVFALFGIAPGTPIDRRSTVEMYCSESRKVLERLRADAIAQCGSFTFEAQISRVDGVRRWMRVTADVVSQNGRAVQLYGTKQDITAEIDAVPDRARAAMRR